MLQTVETTSSIPSIPERRLRALTMLNQRGDTTITWEADADEQMTGIIQKKMDEGVTFFVIEPRFGAPPVKSQLDDARDAFKYRSVIVPDADLAAFVGSGAGTAVKTPSARVKTVRKTKDAAEVARSESVGVKQMKGG